MLWPAFEGLASFGFLSPDLQPSPDKDPEKENTTTLYACVALHTKVECSCGFSYENVSELVHKLLRSCGKLVSTPMGSTHAPMRMLIRHGSRYMPEQEGVDESTHLCLPQVVFLTVSSDVNTLRHHIPVSSFIEAWTTEAEPYNIQSMLLGKHLSFHLV
jgi:hypothetical protein